MLTGETVPPHRLISVRFTKVFFKLAWRPSLTSTTRPSCSAQAELGELHAAPSKNMPERMITMFLHKLRQLLEAIRQEVRRTFDEQPCPKILDLAVRLYPRVALLLAPDVEQLPQRP